MKVGILTGRSKVNDIIKATVEETAKRYNGIINELSNQILTWSEERKSYRGNQYTSYETQVAVANAMYDGTANWGVNQLTAIVGMRAAFIQPEKINIVKKVKDAEPEYDFAKNFIAVNGLDAEVMPQLVVESELEGKMLLRLAFDPKVAYPVEKEGKALKIENGMVLARFMSQITTPYKIETDPIDYMKYVRVRYSDSLKGLQNLVIENENEFVYRKFGGKINQPNQTPGKVLRVLTEIENIDKGFRDMRESNHLYSIATPELETETTQEAQSANDYIKNNNWKAGKFIAHVGKLGYMQSDSSGITSIVMEIVKLAQTISFNTGIPVHFWFPDQVNNRATAEDISFGLISAAVSSERIIWKSLLNELINKAIKMWNEKSQMTQLRENLIEVELPSATKEKFNLTKEIWLPVRASNNISRQTFLSKLPGIDPEQEMQLLEDERKEVFDQMKGDNPFVEAGKEGAVVDEKQKKLDDEKQKVEQKKGGLPWQQKGK